MTLHAPQIIILALMAIGLGVSIARHGMPRTNENVVVSIISTAIMLALLYWGGFFSCQ